MGKEILSFLLTIKIVELKNGVLRKNVSKDDIRNICVSDVVDRVKWIVFFGIIFLKKANRFEEINISFGFLSFFIFIIFSPDLTTLYLYFLHSSLKFLNFLSLNSHTSLSTFASSILLIWVSEMFTDWTKHGSLTLNNSHITPEFYKALRCEYVCDYAQAPKIGVGDDRSFLVAQRFGVVSLPFTCVFLRSIFSFVKGVWGWMGFLITVPLFILIAFIFKGLLSENYSIRLVLVIVLSIVLAIDFVLVIIPFSFHLLKRHISCNSSFIKKIRQKLETIR
jgi:hypothetical protein